MLNKIKQIITVAAFGLLLVAPVAVPASVAAQDIRSNLCAGTELTTTGDCTNAQSTGDGAIQGIITDVINILSMIVGVIAVIMIIIGGFKYITSGGESNNVTGAKNTIMYAVIGLVIVALAQFIVRFVLGRVTAP